MPTTQQLIRKGRKGKKRVVKTKALGGKPQARGIVTRVMVHEPKKPNSGKRNMARVRLTTGHEVTCLIPGEGHNLQEHHSVLVRGGRSKDLPGVKYKVVRGAIDCAGVRGREQGRSVYGAKRFG